MTTTPPPPQRRTPAKPDPVKAAVSQAILAQFAAETRERFGSDHHFWEVFEGDYTHLGTGSDRNYLEHARPRPGAAEGDSRA